MKSIQGLLKNDQIEEALELFFESPNAKDAAEIIMYGYQNPDFFELSLTVLEAIGSYVSAAD